MGGMLDTFDQLFTNGLNKIILGIFGLSTLFLVMEVTGITLPWISKWINRNRLQETIRLLKELGVDVESQKRINAVARLEQIPGRDLRERVKRRLEKAKIKHRVTVGQEIAATSMHYIDLMGATSDIALAKVYARDLAALWRSLADLGGAVTHIDIDFIVTPKAGSPLLGSCFAVLLNKPFIIHNYEAKFRSEPENPKALFDCNMLPPPGSRGLIVDDSSTGGAKALKLIGDLRRYGWKVSDFLVVFEPQLKASTGQNAAQRLKPLGVALHSIVKT
jgi:orotate phosphoribosyltransferase